MKEQNTYHPQTAKFIATICQNMPEIPSNGIQELIENPKLLQKILKNAFRIYELKIRPLTILLGTHKNGRALWEYLKDDYRITASANNLLDKLVVSAREIKIEVVCITITELGFKDDTTLKEIYERTLKLGLELCPAEVGPQLCWQYSNQSDQACGEFFKIAMETITDSDGYLNVFEIGHENGRRYLNAGFGDPNGLCSRHSRWIFKWQSPKFDRE